MNGKTDNYQKLVSGLNKLIRGSQLLLLTLLIGLFLTIGMRASWSVIFNIHWLFLFALFVIFRIYVIKSAFQSIRIDEQGKYNLLRTDKDFANFAMVILTTSSLLFTAFSDTFFYNQGRIGDTIWYSIAEPKSDINSLLDDVEQANNVIHFFYDLSGSWESTPLNTPVWYNSQTIQELNTFFSFSGAEALSYDEDANCLEALLLAKIRSLMLLKEVQQNQSVKSEFSMHYYSQENVTLFRDTQGNNRISKSDFQGLISLATEIKNLKSVNDKKTDFLEIFRPLVNSVDQQGDKITLILFSDFIHYNPKANDSQLITKDLSELFNRLSYTEVNANFIKIPPSQILKSTLPVDSLVKLTDWDDNISVSGLVNDNFPDDILEAVFKSNKQIEFYCNKDFDSRFTIKAGAGGKDIDIILLRETESDRLASGLFYQNAKNYKTDKYELLSYNRPLPLTNFHGKDLISVMYNGSRLSKPEDKKTIIINVKDGANSKKVKVETVFFRKVPVWASVLFFINGAFLVTLIITWVSLFFYLRLHPPQGDFKSQNNSIKSKLFGLDGKPMIFD